MALIAIGNSGRRRTEVKSIRIDSALNATLGKIARDRGVTENSLISAALTKFAEWDNQTEGYGFVTVPLDLFKDLLYTDSEKQIEETAKEMGPRLLKETLLFWFKRVNMSSFIEYVALISKYSGLARADVDSDGSEWTLTYRHQMGLRWSRFIAAYYGEALRKLFNMDVRSDVSGNQVVLKWTATPS